MVDITKQSNADQGRTDYQYDWQNPDLKKFDFGRMMTRTFHGSLYCGKSFWLPLLILFGLPTFLVSLWPMMLPDGAYGELISGNAESFEAFGEIFTPLNGLILASVYLIFIVITAVLYVALSHNIYGFYNDATPSFKESFNRGVSRLWVTIGASILFVLGVMLGLVLLVIPGLILLLGWYLLTPILAMEDNSVTGSLSRSWELSKGSKRWILLFFVVLMVVSGIIQTLFSLIALPFGNQTEALLEGGTTTFWILSAIGASAAQFAVLILTVAGLTSIYYEIRDLNGDIDTQKLSAIFD